MASLSRWLLFSSPISTSWRLTTSNRLWLSSPTIEATRRRNYSDKQENKDGGKGNEATPTQEDHASDPYLPPWPNGVNPHTGERGGPRGPEPTRYGDWERKGRVSDF